MKPHASNVVPLRPEPPKLPPLTTLSFVHDYWVRKPGRKRGEPFRCFWAVSQSGNRRADVAAGRQMAVEWLRFCGNKNLGPVLLGWSIADMPRNLTGVEIGFLNCIGLLAGNNPYAEEIIQLREAEDRRLAGECQAPWAFAREDG